MVEISYITTPQRLHHTAYSSAAAWSAQQMDMICHHHPGMNIYSVFLGILLKPANIGCMVIG
jgi:hypothetical protein